MNVVLGVGGGIAAYKAAELVRLLEAARTLDPSRNDKCRPAVRSTPYLRCTHRPQSNYGPFFIGRFRTNPLERCRAHSRGPRITTSWWWPGHRRSLGRFAHGLASDFLTTMYLAFTGKVILAPP